MNNTFCGSEPVWANACVGNNGFSDYWTYAKGFFQAANMIVNEVLLDQGKELMVDEYIYPVCFNMRHSVELCLKGAIMQIQDIAQIKNIQMDFDLASSHDINQIWHFLSEESTSLDKRYSFLIDKISPVIQDFGEIDPTGQTFRYPVNTESAKHLIEVSNISFVRLRKAFFFLDKELRLLHDLGEYLIEEYSQKTFTKTLSRCQLWHLAQELPHRSEWSRPSFDRIRHSLKSRHNLSSNEFSRAVKIIERHYEFAPEIGMHPPLLGITKQSIILFLDQYASIHSLAPEFGNLRLGDAIDDILQGLLHYNNLLNQVWEAARPTLTPEVLAGLRTLHYFANTLKFCEYYTEMYNFELHEAQEYFSNSSNHVKESFLHILKKTSVVRNILLSLYFLRHIDIAEEIVQRYEVAEKLDWLDDARNFLLFKKPDYFGYILSP